MRYAERGTALGAMLVVLTLLAILSAGVVRLVAFRVGAAQREAYRLQAQYAVEAGIAHARWRLGQPGGLRAAWDPITDTGSSFTDTLTEGATYTVSLRSYGGYIEAIATGRCYKEQVVVRTLLGMRPPAWFARAVTLGRSSYPLVMAGDSRIRGDVLAGPGGVRTGRIPGEPMPPPAPRIDGEVLAQGEEAGFDPWVFDATMTVLDRHLDGEDGITHSAADLRVFGERITPQAFSDSLRGGVIHFSNPLTLLSAGPDDPPLEGPLTLICEGEMRLQGHLKLRGPVMIAARDSLRVTDQADIRGGVLYSPGLIRLNGTARLEGQALSRYEIVVADQAQVVYPGVLFATGKNDAGRREGGLLIASSQEQSGSFIVHPTAMLLGGAPVMDRTTLKIEPHAQVAGLLYSANYTWLEGTLLGSAATRAFYMERGPTTYINWINDGVIDRHPLADAFRLPLMFSARPHFEMVAWEWLVH